ncbi:hypothetical protein GUJ93_ZPchr0006g41280 [Zizania palustris]|uniref:Uncharacterized protein n=1 Tax=Zizania palustris TaxID=103762 RepID=A0A8J5SN09_ZIZPA|nr:hypothetical protein GUJ93_ZPchr0006g41280 [Zizania palustris]
MRHETNGVAGVGRGWKKRVMEEQDRKEEMHRRGSLGETLPNPPSPSPPAATQRGTPPPPPPPSPPSRRRSAVSLCRLTTQE